MWREFKQFLVKENVLALAIAVVLGAAMSKLVTAVVNDFIMPIISAVTPGGDFLGALLDFLIIAFVVWRISKALIRPAAAAEKPATRECPHCRSTIDARATRCAHCTATLERAAYKTALHCDRFGIPPVFCNAADLEAGRPGITTHVECSTAFGGSHWDPGPGWPRSLFMSYVKRYLKEMQATGYSSTAT